VLDDVLDPVVFEHCVLEYLRAVLAAHTLDHAAH